MEEQRPRKCVGETITKREKVKLDREVKLTVNKKIQKSKWWG